MDHEQLKDMAAAYSLGALDEGEAVAFEAHLQEGCAECELAVREMQQTVALLPFAADPVAPPSPVKDRIMASIQPPPEAAPVVAAAGSSASDPVATLLDSVARKWRRIAWGLGGALAVATLGGIWFIGGLQDENDRLRSRLQISTELVEQMQSELQDKERRLIALRAPEIDIIELAGQEPAASASGRVVVDRSSGQAWFVGFDLPDLPDDRDYQLWMLRGNQPVDAGVFNTRENGVWESQFSAISDLENLSAFAVTLEPKGGVPQPTGQMYLVGAVGG